MRRADRLFQIVQILRRHRRTTVTAAQLAAQLEISERTVYRDIRDLQAAGTPIDGAAGVGYRLRADYDLPPLMFDVEEIQALVLGARIVASFGDRGLARAAASALDKIASILPKHLEPMVSATSLYVPSVPWARGPAELAPVREALLARRKLRLAYRTEDGRDSTRVVRPLGAFFWGKVWTLAAWCELRQDFRSFRIDRIVELELLADTFDEEPGRTLTDMLAHYGPAAAGPLSRR